MRNSDLDGEEGYGSLENILHVKHMRKLDNNSQKAYVKKLWVENPKVYSQWKQWCIELDQLPDFFGTDDNPILLLFLKILYMVLNYKIFFVLFFRLNRILRQVIFKTETNTIIKEYNPHNHRAVVQVVKKCPKRK